MKFSETNLQGLFLIEPELIEDERGLFARSWSRKEFVEHGLNPQLMECDISFNRVKGTVRGMHFQLAPYEEAKLVRCTRGAIYDVAVDVRPDSPNRYCWTSLELTADNRRMLYIPEGFAHGFQTLEDATEIFYQISESYHPDAARGLRWDDPRLNIKWPLEVSLMSSRDREFELL
jgi:dTDP-4-dehydrorhamnose 3,5-epimerase